MFSRFFTEKLGWKWNGSVQFNAYFYSKRVFIEKQISSLYFNIRNKS